MNETLLILGMALATMATRIPVLLWLSRGKLPGSVRAALHFVPPAVLSAIILPIVLMPEGDLFLALDNSFLAAGIFATLVAWRTRNLLLTIVLGMAALWAWQALIPLL